jgi:hypothetical protein
MADSCIDNLETLSYGPFAVDQIKSLVLDLDPEFTKTLAAASSRLRAPEAMRRTASRAARSR